MKRWMKMKREELVNYGERILRRLCDGECEQNTEEVLVVIGSLAIKIARNSKFVLRLIFQSQFLPLGNFQLSLR